MLYAAMVWNIHATLNTTLGSDFSLYKKWLATPTKQATSIPHPRNIDLAKL
jgi:hypothetical protein